MKYTLLVLVAAFIEVHSAPLVAKVTPEDTKGYLVFSDGTFWSVASLEKRWRTPLEWLAGNELFVPEDYACKVTEWSFGDEYEIYHKAGNLRVDETYASNGEQLKQHSFLMLNLRSGKTFFASRMQPMDLIQAIYDEGYHSGYHQGYPSGYEEGYSVGYSSGYHRAEADILKKSNKVEF
ncbi:MAG: hypothetical protein A3D96_00240 [Chlamydiae bacterium RIFCSPHIGHO2_12_FULL_44_59]|nr:MAG: hypothetical protein A2796_07385 [Chlamydiae bacterium RIFCSPHIGHO2_01_FULL_44_39]OGN57315.1 MAG: hypothetical protein A3C42_03150 [Chlamydiae bacterium RIFCSPHIGHO2_02_FULL_45_9]OGN60812.1 MAG: hypothetical protein A3D96_00240 [Chlamydiae bacterium RIFCSPHIGHO2_12_FULL_44_59]OGN66688.1 MAG: hypothetical protein A2978_02875 [Chlamydiae bacterium RIFCSPLOWO2_01_FULL_44_52]OGN67338.1 MAG: hypothetical protein A3I67_06070 [Chlamydiae bacterium RIFCSPLOWO2_02_FULL_45_22]OGN70613.1 MAG: hyp